MKFKISMIGNPILKQCAEKVEFVDRNIKKILNAMIQIMYEAKGIGLAAPQIGISKKLIVIDIGNGLIEVINPEIVKQVGCYVDKEGCLSVPKIFGDVERAEKISIIGIDRNMRNVKIKAEGLLARVFQHELDHLNGELFIEKAKNLIDKNSINKNE